MRKFLFFVFIVFCFSCSPNNVTVDDSLGNYFKENNVQGCFALFNNGTGEFTVYDLDRYKKGQFLPASTFNIINSLIGLQTGVISGSNMIIKWDSVVRAVSDWNKDLTMREAFRVSSVPYYQEVARRIGKDTMQFWLDSLHYGSKKIKTRIDTFWLDNSLKITPDEELGLVKRLYFNMLPFYGPYQDTVKKIMLFEDKPEYRLSYKTGWGRTAQGNHLGWMVGWIEENRHPYFFVLNLESKEKDFDMVTVRMKILKDILAQLGFMKGIK